MAQYLTINHENDDINNAAFYYSINMLRMLRAANLITEDDYKRILRICAQHYNVDYLYV